MVDVAEEEEEEAPIVTVAHTIEAIPSPPRSPFRFVATDTGRQSIIKIIITIIMIMIILDACGDSAMH